MANPVKALLDTSVLITDVIPTGADEYAISVVSISELHFGVLRAKSPGEQQRRLRRLSAIERQFSALPITANVARIHGSMAAVLAANKRTAQRRSMDLMIAATAAAHGAELFTHNGDDFRGLDDFLTVHQL